MFYTANDSTPSILPSSVPSSPLYGVRVSPVRTFNLPCTKVRPSLYEGLISPVRTFDFPCTRKRPSLYHHFFPYGFAGVSSSPPNPIRRRGGSGGSNVWIIVSTPCSTRDKRFSWLAKYFFMSSSSRFSALPRRRYALITFVAQMRNCVARLELTRYPTEITTSRL